MRSYQIVLLVPIIMMPHLTACAADLSGDYAKPMELLKAEPPKSKLPKAEPPKSEPPMAESSKSEPSKSEPPKAESSKSEPPNSEPPKAEPPKTAKDVYWNIFIQQRFIIFLLSILGALVGFLIVWGVKKFIITRMHLMRQIDLLATVVRQYIDNRGDDLFFPLCPIDRGDAFKDIALHTDAVTAVHVMEIAEAIQVISDMRRSSDTKAADLDEIYTRYVTNADRFILRLLQDEIGWWNDYWFSKFIYSRAEDESDNRPPPEFERALRYVKGHGYTREIRSVVRNFVDSRRKGDRKILELFDPIQ